MCRCRVFGEMMAPSCHGYPDVLLLVQASPAEPLAALQLRLLPRCWRLLT